jgi:cytochrome b561
MGLAEERRSKRFRDPGSLALTARIASFLFGAFLAICGGYLLIQERAATFSWGILISMLLMLGGLWLLWQSVYATPSRVERIASGFGGDPFTFILMLAIFPLAWLITRGRGKK